MVGVRIELALKRRERLHFGRLIGGVEVGLVAGKTVDARVLRLQGTQHMIEGPVFHHQYDDML